jgi:biopolymer transport protein ExbD
MQNRILLPALLIGAALSGGCKSPPDSPQQASNASKSIETNAPPPAEPIAPAQAQELRVILRHRARTGDVIRIVGKKLAHDDTELESLLRSEKEARRSESGEDPVVTIDATMDVPWNAIVTVLNACQHLGIERVEFDFGPEAR